MALDISSLERTGDFINFSEVEGRLKLTFGNLLDRLGNDLKLLKNEVDAVSTRMNYIRGNLSGPIGGNMTGANQYLINIDSYLKIWRKIYVFNNIMVYAFNHVMYDDDDISYTSKNPRFSASHIADNINEDTTEGAFYQIYESIAAATSLTDIEAQLTAADQNGDIVDDFDLGTLETLINTEIETVSSYVVLAQLAINAYANFLTDDFIDALTIMETTLYNRDLLTIHDLVYNKIDDVFNDVANYNSTTGAMKAAYLEVAQTSFSELNTLMNTFNDVATSYSAELTQILVDKEDIKYTLVETQMDTVTSMDALKLAIIESLELIDETLTGVRNVFISRLNALGTLPSS